MSTQTQRKSRAGKRWIKFFLLLLLIGFVGLIASYFYLTSELFLKYTLLPWLGSISASEYSANTVELSLWHSSLKMTGVRVGSKTHPFITGDLKGSFSLWRILHGDIKVDNLTLDNVKVVLRQHAIRDLVEEGIIQYSRKALVVIRKGTDLLDNTRVDDVITLTTGEGSKWINLGSSKGKLQMRVVPLQPTGLSTEWRVFWLGKSDNDTSSAPWVSPESLNADTGHPTSSPAMLPPGPDCHPMHKTSHCPCSPSHGFPTLRAVC